jgi:2-phospho-L-lactate guanylyltransferase
MRTAAILPLKAFSKAKSRLAASRPAELRARLAEAMATDVLDALSACPALEQVYAVCADRPTEELAGAFGAQSIADRSLAGQSAAVTVGIARACEEGFERVLCVPGDCPALSADDLSALLLQERTPALTIVPDRHGTGTNALLIAPPRLVAPSFGPGSFARHLESGRAAGLEPVVARPAGLVLDIDSAEDLAQLRAQISLLARSSKTRALLEASAVLDSPSGAIGSPGR